MLLGIGAGLSFPSLTTLAMRGVQPGEAGLASGLINTSLQVGGALGLAVLASLSATRTDSVLADGGSGAAATLEGYHFAFWIAAGIAAAAIAVALLVLRSAPAQTAAGRGADGRGAAGVGMTCGGYRVRGLDSAARCPPTSSSP